MSVSVFGGEPPEYSREPDDEAPPDCDTCGDIGHVYRSLGDGTCVDEPCPDCERGFRAAHEWLQ